jgi:hypothetical protein
VKVNEYVLVPWGIELSQLSYTGETILPDCAKAVTPSYVDGPQGLMSIWILKQSGGAHEGF